MIRPWLLAIQEICFQNIIKNKVGRSLEANRRFQMKQIHLKKENLKDGRGLGERKPGSRRNRRTLDHKEEEAREER